MSLHSCPILSFLFLQSIPFPYCTFFHSLVGIQTMNTRMTLPMDKGLIFYAGELDNEGDMEDDDLPPDLLRLVEQDERQILLHQEITKAVNLGTEKERKEVKIGTTLSPDTRKELIDLLQDYSDVFAWSYQDMPGLDTDIVVHRLPLREECALVKQKLRWSFENNSDA